MQGIFLLMFKYTTTYVLVSLCDLCTDLAEAGRNVEIVFLQLEQVWFCQPQF